MTTHTAGPLFAEPLATPNELNYGRADGLVDVYGHCSWFCAISQEGPDIPPRGSSVEVHGPMCQAQAGLIHGLSSDGQVVDVTVTVVQPYAHGTYKEFPKHVHDEFVSLESFIDDDSRPEAEPVYLSVGEARRMIAALQYAVDNLDKVIRPLPSNG